MDPTHLPTKILRDGPSQQIADVQRIRVSLVVRDNFRQAVERLEPDRHQFEPVEIVFKDGTSAGQFYLFFICTRLDCMDPEKTTHKRSIYWEYVSGGKFVVSLSMTEGYHIWIDPHFDVNARIHPFISEELKAALEEAGVTGIRFNDRLTA